MWKLLAGIIEDEIYGHLEKSSLLQNEQNVCRRVSRGTKEQLLIDRTILTNCREAKRNLAMEFIDYKKAYDMMPHSCLYKTLKMVEVSKQHLQIIMSEHV